MLTPCRKMFLTAAVSILFFGIKSLAQNKKTLASKLYYFSPSGDDKNTGSKESPLKTINKFNSISLNSGDAVFFEGGKTFNGTLQVNVKDAGNATEPILISSYGSGYPIINAGNSSAINIFNTNYVSVKKLFEFLAKN